MFHSMHRHFNATGLVVAFALVFAMTGGAWAANRYIITSPKQIKPSVLAQLKGKAGANGAQGPVGPAGAAGAGGPQGSGGPQGPAGNAGGQGVKGETGATGPTGVTGTGKEGPKGTAGSTGTTGATGQTGFTEKLPAGKTETGTYATYINDINTIGKVPVAISFPIPVEEGASPQAFYLEPKETNSDCTGSYESPTAAPGVLCVYSFESKVEFVESIPEEIVSANGETPYGPTGSRIKFSIEGSATERKAAPGYLHVGGTWAVTAPTS